MSTWYDLSVMSNQIDITLKLHPFVNFENKIT